jgi:hypothetical protein
MRRRISVGLADALVGVLVAGVLVGALVGGVGLRGPGVALAIGVAVVAAVVVIGQWIRRRSAAGGP